MPTPCRTAACDVGIDWQSSPITWPSRRVMRSFGSAKATRSVRMAARPAGDTPLAIDQRHPLLGPRQIIPGPLRAIAHAPRRPSAPGTFIPTDAAPLDMDPCRRPRLASFPFDSLNPKAIQTQNPSTLSRRSRLSSLVGSTSRENDTGWSGAKWDRFPTSRPPSRPPTQARSAQAAGYYLKSLYSNR